MKTGIELIAKERRRQIEKEGFDSDHDDEHFHGQLAMAAACYTTPVSLFCADISPHHVLIEDPWPVDWDQEWDKRRRNRKGELIFREDKGRIRDLVKAGALIAAEIDRLQRARNSSQEVRRCRVCGCTDDDCSGCIERTGNPCHWIEEDLCSACAGSED